MKKRYINKNEKFIFFFFFFKKISKMNVNFSSDSLKIIENDPIDIFKQIFCIVWLILAALGVSSKCSTFEKN